MRPVLRVARALAALTAAGALLALPSGPAGAEDQTVTANAQNQFTPETVTVDPGDTVTWQWAGGFGHTVTSRSGPWSHDAALGPPALSPQTSVTFETPGTYTYYCRTHDNAGMRGTVVVTGSTTTPKPTRPRTRPPTTRPTATRTSTAPQPSASASATPTPTASASAVVPTVSVVPRTPTTPGPTPDVAGPEPSGPAPYLGEGGLTPHPASPRGKGLPIMLALLLIGGVGSAEIRALLAVAPDES